MGRPGKKKTLITKFPQPSTTVPPVQPIQPTTAGLPAGAGALGLPPIQPDAGYYRPPEDEPVTFPPEMTIEELIENRRIWGKNDSRYWAAFDEIQKKRDFMFEVHHNSMLKAIQDLTIAMYKSNKMKVPKTVGQPFDKD